MDSVSNQQRHERNTFNDSLQTRLLGTVGLGLCASILTYLYYKYKYAKKEVLPTIWKQVGTLEEVHFYPIKSCAAIELDEAFCENLGIQVGDEIKDRALMVIEKNGNVITARGYPKMLLIVSKIVGPSEMIITAPGMKDLHFDYSKLANIDNFTKAEIYGHSATVKDCGKECNTWFSTYILGQPEGLLLVYYPCVDPTRPVAGVFQNGIFCQTDTGTFQDVSSYHLINNASIKDLNSRLTNEIFPRQFRSNFYINTESAFGEDNWHWIRIGNEAVFRNIAPCYRCILPNINPFTAQRDSDGQPLRTLKKYRMKPNSPVKSPVMGIQMGLRSVGRVKKGDAVFIEGVI